MTENMKFADIMSELNTTVPEQTSLSTWFFVYKVKTVTAYHVWLWRLPDAFRHATWKVYYNMVTIFQDK